MGISRSYVIATETETQSDGLELTKIVGLRSSKKLAIRACEEAVISPGTWDFKEKHKGRIIGTDINVTYEMFYVNKEFL